TILADQVLSTTTFSIPAAHDHEIYCAIDDTDGLVARLTDARRDLDRASDVSLSRISTAYAIRSACPLFLVCIRIVRHAGAPGGSAIYLSISAASGGELPDHRPTPFSLVGLDIRFFHTLLLDVSMEAL